MVTTIGVLAAIPQERSSLERAMTGISSRDGFSVGSIDGHDVCVGSTGIGKVNAAIAATRLCERFLPSVIVFTGVAGGIDPSLSIGDVVIGTNVIQHDAGVLTDSGIETYQAGHIPFFNPTDRLGFEPTAELITSVRRELGDEPIPLSSGRRVMFGTILTGDQFLASNAERSRLRDRFGAQAIEMEGGAVAQVAESYGIDHLAIRTLSDSADSESAGDFTEFVNLVADQTVEILRRILPAVSTAEPRRQRR